MKVSNLAPLLVLGWCCSVVVACGRRAPPHAIAGPEDSDGVPQASDAIDTADAITPNDLPVSLSAATIQSVVARFAEQLIDKCRDESVEAGKTEYSALISVNPKGRAETFTSNAPFTVLEMCVNTLMGSIPFPRSKHGGEASVKLKF